jgi:uncharacterized protein (TIGR02246 family)
MTTNVTLLGALRDFGEELQLKFLSEKPKMKAAELSLLTIFMACTLAIASAASDPTSPAGQRGQETNSSDQSSPEYKAITGGARKYEEAYNRGDAKELASRYTEDVDYIDQDGVEVSGRDAMQKLLADNFQANPGGKLAITIDEVKQISPDVLVDRGIATVTPANGAAESTRYVAIHVKKGDHWPISQLTETAAPAPSAYSQLQALEWLIGNWEDKTGDQTVQTKINWAGDKNFLVRRFTVKGVDQSETHGWEIIGWDPAQQQIRSWIFDSNGGFEESTWANDGEHWLIKASNVLPNGDRSTAEHVLTRVDDNKFSWESQNRTLNGDLQPSLDKIEVQRVTQNP